MLPRFAVNRPVTVLMATLAISIFGILALRRLPVDLLPDLSYPTLTVQTEYADAAPVSIEQFVTRPIEEAVGVIPGVREMRSTSRPGISEVVLEFEWGESMEIAGLEVRERLGLVELPREAEIPRVLRFDPSLEPVMRLALVGDRPLDELRQLADRWLKPRLEAIPGVAAARVRGGLDPEIVVEADEDRLAALGLGLGDLEQALREENVNQPGGTLRDFNAIYLVRTLHEFDDLDQIRRTVIREGATGRVRVEDVATVARGHRDRDEITRLDGREVVEIDLQRQGLTNTVTVARTIRSTLTGLQEEMPSDLGLEILTDLSDYITAAVAEVWSAAIIGGVLAIFVLYFFLRDLRATSIITLTIPVSVVATFLAMQQAGVTLNIMSLGGLALGIGMLVDNSIVVLEAIDRRRGLGLDTTQAAVTGACEVSGAVTAATLTTVSVFLPIIFVQGVAGQLFYDQAITVCLSLATSLVVSLTLIPALSASPWLAGLAAANHTATPEPALSIGNLRLRRPLRGPGKASSIVNTLLLGAVQLPLLLVCGSLGVLWKLARGVFDVVALPFAHAVNRLNAAYPGMLRAALGRRFLVLAVAFALLGLSVAALPYLGTNLVPDLAQGEFAFQLRHPEGTTLAANAATVERIETMLSAEPRVGRLFSLIGSLPSSASGRRTLGENLAQINLRLPEGSSAEDEARAIERFRKALAVFPQVEAELARPAVLSVRPPIAVQVFAEDLDVLEDAAARIKATLETLPELRDVTSTSEPGSPEILIDVDKERAAALGVSAEDIGTALRAKISGEVVGEFRDGEERIDIRLRAAESFRSLASQVEALRIVLPNGTAVPVSAAARVEVGRGPAAIYRIGGSRVAEVSALATVSDLGSVLATVASRVENPSLVEAATARLAGQNKELERSFASLWLALALASFLVYVVLASQFESVIHPFVILAALPLGAIGVIAALLLTRTPISVLALIGAVMLAGIVVNNAIVLVDAINRRRREGQELEEAIVNGAQERLRPILMTTLTTVLALLPMALGLGAGNELRTPLAITVVGGLSVATLLTLGVTPCLYRILAAAPVRPRRADSGSNDPRVVDAGDAA